VPRFLTNTSAQRGLTGPVAVSGGGHHPDRGRVVCWTHQIDSYPGREQHLTALCDGRSVAGLTLDSPVVRAQFAKRRRMLDTTAKSDGIVAHHLQAGSKRESGTRPGVASTVAGTRQPDRANRRSDTDLFASESGTDGALSEAFQAG
jgi:hypothetical protein